MMRRRLAIRVSGLAFASDDKRKTRDAMRTEFILGCLRNLPGWRVALAGGNVNNGANAGFATLNANNAASNRNTNIGSHVCLI